MNPVLAIALKALTAAALFVGAVVALMVLVS